MEKIPNPWFEGPGEIRVVVAPESLHTGNGSGRLITLSHPKSGNKVCYLLSDEALHELHWFKQPYGSWFLGNYVSENDGMYFITPVDLVFVLLPLLDKARMRKGNDADSHPGNFRQLEEVLFLDGYPDYHSLLPLAEAAIAVVCQVKEVGDFKFFRLDDAKVLAWLACKANQLKAALPKLDEHYAGRYERDTLMDSVLIMGEYLSESWLKLLCDHLKLGFEQVTAATQPASVAAVSAGNGEAQSNLFQPKSASEKKNSKPAKKPKVETKSQNIGDMFRRVTRRG
uniref:Ribonuclease H2 subunit B n=1 Tax=Kalanchoe fedtschenkoi TaxID=63787 RepID=A0A7N0R897_KALFE